MSARGGAALSSRGDGRDSKTWLGQELEGTSELKFVGKGGNHEPTDAPYKARSGGEQFSEQR